MRDYAPPVNSSELILVLNELSCVKFGNLQKVFRGLFATYHEK